MTHSKPRFEDNYSLNFYIKKKMKIDFKTNLGTVTLLSNEACTFSLIGLPV